MAEDETALENENNPTAALADYAMEFVDRVREDHEDEFNHVALGEIAIVAEVIVTDEEGNEMVLVDGLSSVTTEWQQVGLLRGAIQSIERSWALRRIDVDDD
jgi:hypothetical protein